MYCVVGEKVLRCEVSEKLENYSWVRIGKVEKGQTVPNNRIFETEMAARDFIRKRDIRKSEVDKEIVNEINACKRAYEDFFKETGISVRVIDRLFRIKDVEKQLAHLRKKYNKSEEAKEAGVKTPKDSRQFSTKPSSSFKSSKESNENNGSNYPFKNKKTSKFEPKNSSNTKNKNEAKSQDKGKFQDKGKIQKQNNRPSTKLSGRTYK